jgi:hypothetical protein
MSNCRIWTQDQKSTAGVLAALKPGGMVVMEVAADYRSFVKRPISTNGEKSISCVSLPLSGSRR